MGETRSMTGFQRTKEYQRFGQPDNADDWIQDRIYLREKLVEKGIEQLYRGNRREAAIRCNNSWRTDGIRLRGVENVPME